MMKKIFTIASAILLPLCALATPIMPEKVTKGGLKATPEMMQKVMSLHDQMESIGESHVSTPTALKRIYNDGKYNYRLLVNYTGYKLTDWWWFLDENKDTLTFQDLPFYIVEYDLTRFDENGKIADRADCLVSWPGYKMWEITDKEYANNYEMVPLDVIATKQDKGLCSTFAYYSDDNILYQWDRDAQQVTCYAIWSNRFGQDQVYEGQKAKFDAPSTTRTSMFTINDFEEATDNMYSENQFYFVLADNDARKGNLKVVYDGSIRTQGFKENNYNWNISELHVFNAGLKDPDYLTTYEDPYDFDWTAKMKFYIYGATEKCHVGKFSDITEFDPTQIGFLWNDDVPENERNNDNYYSFYGPVYAPASDATYEYPYGVYEMEDAQLKFNPLYDMEQLYVIPMDYSIIPRGFKDCMWSDKDGFKFIWQGFYQNMRWPGRIGIGTEDGFVVRGKDNYQNNLSATFKGNMIYHEDPKDISKVREMTTVGEISGVKQNVAVSNDVISIVNGTLTVQCQKATAVVVYDLNGRIVAKGIATPESAAQFNLDKGMYVVKTANKAAKVAL